MRLLKVLGILLIGPFVGSVFGAIVGSFLFQPVRPGQIHLSLGIGFVTFAILSVLVAIRTWRRPTHQNLR